MASDKRSPMTPTAQIRNFSVVAHIDHGKSTLSDRLIQETGGLTAREMKEQVLDNMEIERERGITIKAQTVRLHYRARDGLEYVLNLIDTPGHVDFAYEVSRSLAACEGSLLVVDASQGVEAQTLANVYQALDNNHEIVPVLNKVDLPAADVDRVKTQIEDVIGLDASDAVLCSAKTGLGITDVLEAIVNRLPAPKGDESAPLKALLVDAWYDAYLGVVVLVRIIEGRMTVGQKLKMMQTGASYQVDRLGVFLPKATPVDSLGPGEIGFLTASIKEVADAAVGETLTRVRAALAPDRALIGFAGAPWTVLTYMLERGSSNREAARSYAWTNPAEVDALLAVLVESTALYLAMQVRAGAQALQLFESWAEGLSQTQFERLVIAPHQALIARLRGLGVTVPIIGFPRGCGCLARLYAEQVETQAVALDTSTPMALGREIQALRTIQGALDPLVIRAGGPGLDREVERLLTAWGDGPYVFNLGHGILPDTPIAHVEQVLRRVTGM